MQAQCQAAGGTAAFIDAEHALDLTYAETLGVNIDALLVSQPDDGEQALMTEKLVASGGVDLVVVDFVAALVPRAGPWVMVINRCVHKPDSCESPPKAHRCCTQKRSLCHFHQSTSSKNRGHIWIWGGDHRRKRAKILCQSSTRCPTNRGHQRWTRSHWESNPSPNCKEQTGSPFSTG